MNRDFSRSSSCSKTHSRPTLSHRELSSKYPSALSSKRVPHWHSELCFSKIVLPRLHALLAVRAKCQGIRNADHVKILDAPMSCLHLIHESSEKFVSFLSTFLHKYFFFFLLRLRVTFAFYTRLRKDAVIIQLLWVIPLSYPCCVCTGACESCTKVTLQSLDMLWYSCRFIWKFKVKFSP